MVPMQRWRTMRIDARESTYVHYGVAYGICHQRVQLGRRCVNIARIDVTWPAAEKGSMLSAYSNLPRVLTTRFTYDLSIRL